MPILFYNIVELVRKYENNSTGPTINYRNFNREIIKIVIDYILNREKED